MFSTGGRLLGIDIGQKTIKLVQLKGSVGRYQVSGWGILDKERPNIEKERWPSDLFEDLKLTLQVNGIKSGKASVCIPDSLINISYRKIPSMPEEELVNALKWETGKDWNLALDEMSIDFIPMGEITEGVNTMHAYLVAVARKSLLEDLCSRLTAIGIKVKSIEFSTMAQISCLLGSMDTSGIIALVDLGDQQTNLVVLKDGSVRFFRTINTGGKHITDMISQATGLSWWEADKLKEMGSRGIPGGDEVVSRALSGALEGIIDEVFQTFHFYGAERREGGVDRVVITGGGGLMPGVGDSFQEILGVPSDVLDPFTVFIPSANIRERDKLISRGSRMVTALGLTLDK
jgi:type IV pilus assembly protein PilM